MAQSIYTIDLQDTVFPMLSSQQARTIIVPSAGEPMGEQPGIAYCHNVMPSKYGMDSIGYLQVVPAFTSLPASALFSDVRTIYGTLKSRIYIVWDNLGNIYVLLQGATAWIALPATVPATASPTFSVDSVTIGTVNGVSYIFFSKIGAFNYDEGANTLVAVTLTGLDISEVLGVAGSSGYLVAYTDLAIAWSSTISPTDFVPSQITGAGGGNVAGIEGAILFAISNSLGLIIYSQANAVAGTYTGNTQFPFRFRPIDDSKGGITLDRVAYEANSASQFTYSKAGLQSVTSTKAQNILPEVTDFLAGRVFEDYNETTQLYEITAIPALSTMLKKIKYVASRYLVISYGISSFTHALIFDTSLNKLGKVRTTHVDVFEYIGDQTEISRESIAFLSGDGRVQILDFSVGNASDGVLILGKLQATRTRMLDLQGVVVENAPEGEPLSVSSQVALDGKNFVVVEGELSVEDGDLKEFTFRSEAKNHSIALIGEFNVVSVLVRYVIGSKF